MIRCLSRVLAAALVGWPVHAWALEPKNPRALQLQEEGTAAYKRGDYAAASDAYRQAHEIEPDPQFLYARAQAERKHGNCELAVRLYNEYIDTEPGEVNVAAARDGKALCADALLDGATQGGRDGETLPPRAVEDTTPSDPDDRARPWHRDPLAGSLFGVGLAAGVTGGVLLGISGHRLLLASGTPEERRRIQGDRDYGEYLEWIDRTRAMQIGGAVVAGVGGALIIAGAVRWGLLARHRKASNTTLAPTFGSTRAGVVLQIRF